MIDTWPSRTRTAGAHPSHAVTRAIERMKEDLSQPIQLADLATAVAFSPFHFHRLFRATTNLTPARFLATLRMAESRRLLLHSRLTVAAISARVGYLSVGTFTTQFTRQVGAPPGEFRRLVHRLARTRIADLGDAVARPAGYGGAGGRDGLPVCVRAADPRELLLVGLLATEDAVHTAAAWAIAAGRDVVRLPVPPRPGDYQLHALAVDVDVRLTDALVDLVPGTYRTGVTAVRLTGQPPAAPVPVALCGPRPTDPPLVSIAPLRRVADALRDGHPAGRRCSPHQVPAARLQPAG